MKLQTVAPLRLAALVLLLGSSPCMAQSAPTLAPPCSQQTAECLQRVAQMYLEALRSHDGSRLPLAPDVRRSENALTNARGATQVRASFDQTSMVKDIRDARYFVDATHDQVVVFFLIDVDLKAKDAQASTQSGDTRYQVAVAVPAGTYTVHEAERFRIVRGVITDIEIIAHVEDGKGMGSGWPVARDKVISGPKSGDAPDRR